MSCSAAILAGGMSTRFGTDKALFAIDGAPMICRVHDRLCRQFKHVFVAGGQEAAIRNLGLEYYPDNIRGKGILSGLHTALRHATSEWVFCCACDMPLVNQAVIRLILDQRPHGDVLLPVIGEMRQPLHALYRTSIMPVVEQCCRTASNHLPDLLTSVSVRYLDDSYFDHLPNYRLSFVNMNDQATLDSYRADLERF